jgi:hypothetical protein
VDGVGLEHDRGLEDVAVIPLAAEQCVAAIAAIEGVIAIAADEEVAGRVADQRVIARPAEDRLDQARRGAVDGAVEVRADLVAGQCAGEIDREPIASGQAGEVQRVVAAGRFLGDRVGLGDAGRREDVEIVANAAAQVVIAAAAGERVVARFTAQRVVARIARDAVVGGVAGDRIASRAADDVLELVAIAPLTVRFSVRFALTAPRSSVSMPPVSKTVSICAAAALRKR